MRNLVLHEKILQDTGVKDSQLIAVDTLNESLYIATKYDVNGYNTSTKEGTSYLSLVDEGYLDSTGEDQIIGFDFLQDQESLCIITSKGDVLLWQTEVNNLENVGSVECGFTSCCWSPDQELLVLTTKNESFIVMTKDFDPLNEFPLHSKEFGEATPMNVGWGKKETQFHGSEGKEAAKEKKSERTAVILATDDKRTEVTWRGDGQYFAITSVDPSSEMRFMRIYNNEGVLQATNEVIEGMEHSIQWRPSGNLIASSQRKPNKHDIIFFEKNGLQHGEFTLPFGKEEKLVKNITWNPSSDILTLHLQDLREKGNQSVQLWTVNNYHWYLKQEMKFDGGEPCLIWDPENSYKLHILTSDGIYQQNNYIYEVCQSKGNGNLAMVAVIDGSSVRLTPFRHTVIPPPMSAYTISAGSTINQAVFGTGDIKHNLFIRTSVGFAYAKYDLDSKNYSVKELTGCGDLDLQHMVFLSENAVVGLLVQSNGVYAVLIKLNGKEHTLSKRSQLELGNDALKLFKSEDEQPELLVNYKDGTVRTLICKQDDTIKLSDDNVSLPHPCEYMASKRFNGQQFVFGLTSHYRMFINNKELASNCTSFLLHDDFLLLTTHSHNLRCIYIKCLVQDKEIVETASSLDEAHRRLERGSKLVTAVSQGTAVVLQMPRGNLECIHPRALIVTHLQKLLTGLQYKEALEIMRKHRINLNLIYDHNPQLFLDNVSTFVDQINSANRMNLFLADISPEDVCTTLYYPFYHHGEEKNNSSRFKNSPTKVDIVCQAVRQAIERSPNKEKLLLSLLTTHAKQSVPDLETVLIKLKALKDNGGVGSIVPYDKAVAYILYLVDVNQLFDIALGLYDFDIVIMVAEKSHKDPKEYLPFLNNFKNMEENYRKFSIDKHLKRYSKALRHLVKCADKFEECLKFICEHELYKEAMNLFPQNGEEYKQLSSAYGQYLHKKKYYEEAALVYSRCGFHDDALESLLHTTNWNMALMESKLSGHDQGKFLALCRKFSDRLKSHRLYADAALLQEYYIKDIEESVVCLLEGHLWFHALNLIQRHEREDLIETNLKPAIHDCHEQLTERIKELAETFEKHRNRLVIVVENKKREEWEILEGIRDDPQNDLYSDTSSITGQSAISASSKSSKGTRTSGHSRKSRNKGERKRYSLREGSKHEDFALREALVEVVNSADHLKEEVCSLSKILVFYFEESKASSLQILLDKLLTTIQNNKDEIWANESKDANETAFEYGPGATVQSILEQKNATTAKPRRDMPEPSRPVLRPNIKWKLSTIS